MSDLIAQIDLLTAKSTSQASKLLSACREEILSGRQRLNTEWFDITTLPFPYDRGDHHRVDSVVWLSNVATGEVRTGRPIRRKRDGVIGLFAESFFPTHWMPFIRPNPPTKPMETS